jgi:protein involved in polysaccharide export with SLBB domain
MMIWSARILVILLVLCGACATRVGVPQELEASEKVVDYRIQIGDKLSIVFPFDQQLNQEVIVRADGRIALPLVEEIEVAGLFPEDLAAQLKFLYREELAHPEVLVSVRASAQRVFILGEVAVPGEVTWVPRLTALQAAAKAGGFTDRARLTHVTVIRRTKSGEKHVATHNLKVAFDDPLAAVYLKPYDTVYVPLSRVARVNLWVDQFIRRNIPIPIVFRF